MQGTGSSLIWAHTRHCHYISLHWSTLGNCQARHSLLLPELMDHTLSPLPPFYPPRTLSPSQGPRSWQQWGIKCLWNCHLNTSKYSFPPCNHNRPNYWSTDTSISPLEWHPSGGGKVACRGHLGPVNVRWLHGCGDLVISQEQVIGGELGADTATCHQGPMWLLWNTSIAGQCSGILSVILSTFIRIKDLYIKGSQESQGMLKIFQVVLIQILMWVWVSAVEAVEQWSHDDRHNMTRPWPRVCSL